MRTAAVLLCLPLALACSVSLEAPPVDVEYRESLVGLGQIVRITNGHTEALTDLEVRIENPNGDVKHHAIAALAPGETVELGWKKLDGFEVAVGAELSIKGEGYALPALIELASD